MFPTGFFCAGYFAPRYWERPSAVTHGSGAPGVGTRQLPVSRYQPYKTFEEMRREEEELVVLLLIGELDE